MLAICPPFFLQEQRFLPRAAAEGKSQTIFIPVGGKNMQKLRKFLDHVIQLERYICCALLVAIMVICFGAVVMRYVVSKPWSWSEEVIIVMLVWFGFMVMSVETYNDSNIAITGFYSKFPKPLQKACDVLRHVLLTAFFYLMMTDSWKIFVLNSRKRLPASHWNQGFQYFPMVLGGALMFAFSIINLIGVFVKEERQTSDGVERFEKGFDKLFKKGGKKS